MSLQWSDIVSTAETINVDPCALHAIYTVESRGEGYLPNGDPKILFEAHIFYKRLKKHGINPESLINAYPTIISRNWNRSLYKGGIQEHERLELAASINRAAALESASWGSFQIMGFNYGICKYADVFDFVNDMYDNEPGQLRVLTNFLRGANIVQPLQRLDWNTVALRYNGEEYAKNNYHIKLKQSYEQCKRERG